MVATSAWHAWLLFRGRNVRFALWTIVPLMSQFFPPALGSYTGFLLLPVLEIMLLSKVRRGLGFWILARYLGIPLIAIASNVVNATIGLPILTFLLNHLTDAMGVAPGALSGFARVGGVAGPELVCEALLAATLAWKMPPLSFRMKAAQEPTEVNQPSVS